MGPRPPGGAHHAQDVGDQAVRPLHDRRGMTLLEVLIAISMVALIVVVLASSLRVATRAWEAGERRAQVQQEVRAVVELVTEALAGAHPYRGRLGGGLQRVVLFQGEPDEVRFVTTAPPLALEAPAAPFHAVTLALAEDELRVVERLVPAEEPFGDGPKVVLSRSVTELKLEYLDPKTGWQDRWDGPTAATLPQAVRIDLTVRSHGRSEKLPAFVVPFAVRGTSS